MVSLRRDGKTASDRRKLRAFGITSSFVIEESRCFGVLGWEYHFSANPDCVMQHSRTPSFLLVK